MHQHTKPERLTTAAEIAEFCDQARASAYLALDTEFMRERTYYPQLCLLQLATSDRIVMLDPLEGGDITPLLPVLSDPAVIKILHSPRQDQEVMALTHSVTMSPLFDTQFAAALLGHSPQEGYAKLVASQLGVELSKDQTRTNWARRPLTAAQLDYAADDVRYLEQLRAALAERLASVGRLDWMEEEMTLVAQQSVLPDPASAWKRIKGVGRLSDAQRAAVAVLAGWREERAMDRDLPRQWVVSDKELLAVVEAAPRARTELERIDGLDAKTARRWGDALIKGLEAAEGRPPPPMVTAIPDKAVMKALSVALRERAQALDIEPSVLATRADLTALAQSGADASDDQLRVLTGWRLDAVGRVLLDTLNAAESV